MKNVDFFYLKKKRQKRIKPTKANRTSSFKKWIFFKKKNPKKKREKHIFIAPSRNNQQIYYGNKPFPLCQAGPPFISWYTDLRCIRPVILYMYERREGGDTDG